MRKAILTILVGTVTATAVVASAAVSMTLESAAIVGPRGKKASLKVAIHNSGTGDVYLNGLRPTLDGEGAELDVLPFFSNAPVRLNAGAFWTGVIAAIEVVDDAPCADLRGAFVLIGGSTDLSRDDIASQYFSVDVRIPADLNGDDVVDQADLGELLGSYGVDDGGDIDGDGDTDQADLGILLGAFGDGC